MAGKRHKGIGPRPHTWCTGPDPLTHEQYNAFVQARAQADYRREGWELTFAEYQLAWEYKWHLRGRTRDSVCITRIDHDLPWSNNNIRIVTRQEHAQRQADARRRERDASGRLLPKVPK